MKNLVAGLALASLLAGTKAVDPNGDPTDLNNYPPCAQRCIPETFGPPSNCGSLSNRTCLCTTAGAARILTGCELATCTAAELDQINPLAVALCAPVGGIAPVASGIQSSILASSQFQIPTTVSFAPSVTGVDQASSILATATPAPNLGNPAGNVYPNCTLTCVNETAGLITEPNNLYQICGVLYRTQTAVCEAALCSDSDRQNSQLLGQQICRPFYHNNVALGSSVIASIASATPIAQAAVAGKSATDQSSWPQCARSCQDSTNFGGCGALTNQTCLCGNSTAIAPLNDCEDATCSTDDRIRTNALGYQLCANFSSISTLTNVPTNTSTNSSVDSPTPSPFTGQASKIAYGGITWVVTAMGLLTMVILL
ncbi:MAG: hypothetical protein L6R42_008900 [Xanthoria sp. 1 TBL-2021]|nr:MAG: hypothetical protein L6R42_008900 [Xanthoria sp. 1 TBL-2021]